MATADEQQQQPTFRAGSPSPETSPVPALGAYSDRSRCVSTASSFSNISSIGPPSRASLASDFSRHSSASYHSRRSDVSNLSRQSTHPSDARARRRGYMRPHGTDFAASARSRESVMSLGSIAHLQYYFARTGLLDGKGGQLARKKQAAANLDMSALDGSSNSTPRIVASDIDSTYASMGNSPEMGAQHFDTVNMMESPIDEGHEAYEDDDSFAESDPGMLPPTVSTYHHREKVVPKPPTIQELKTELQQTLAAAAKALQEVRERKTGTYEEPPNSPQYTNMPEENTQGWYELQGMHVLDVSTLAIRAAKIYYTAHELPDRLDSIKSEKQIRADLLAVMEVLKQMATRGFRGGMKDDEVKTIDDWVASVFHILQREEEIENAERAERDSWVWFKGDWTGRERERERAFLMAMDPDAEPLPEWTPASESTEVPTPFLQAMQNGLRLVKLHNAVVKKSRRRFGAIPTFHTDTQKPYRCMDNLRYWVKAAELRFEVTLKVDPLGLAYNTGPQVWQDFEDAILKWCRHVREEITRELEG
ncbi:hypothetical protein S40285_00651 [Stachybotrys chlorohalonatus IBT 40285]|uniref:Uncharacterized protein n=1 Tax=Stachybotrys chlorohalonatus (strain IBT 40285) TaxID=1283841 RepID=A0A084R2I0_STAC4|nr:hypothetical protein S40285_00651 [Stachybotrys chlorohalonata IBT 40285]